MTRNSKATEFQQPGNRRGNAEKLIESKRFVVYGRKFDVEQVAEAYMLKRDHPKFKGNLISATGASKTECRETHGAKPFGHLRKKSDVELVAEAYILKRDHPKFKGN